MFFLNKFNTLMYSFLILKSISDIFILSTLELFNNFGSSSNVVLIHKAINWDNNAINKFPLDPTKFTITPAKKLPNIIPIP